MKSQFKNFQTKKRYDLEERTAVFAENVIDLCKKLKKDAINNRLISQCVAAGGGSQARFEN
jgi:hypothetical protein